MKSLSVLALLMLSLISGNLNAAPQVPAAETGKAFEKYLDGLEMTVQSVEMYGIFVDARREFSWSIQPNRDHYFLRLNFGKFSGWAEVCLFYNKKKTGLVARTKSADWYQELIGLNPKQVLEVIRGKRGKIYTRPIEAMELCLIDAVGKALDQPALELLGLGTKGQPASIYTILSNDPKKVAAETKRALSLGLKTHLKLKLFGEETLDLELVKTARAAYGPVGFILADPNNAYRKKLSEKGIEEMAATLKRLHAAGLNAIEDPGQLTTPQWIDLQKAVHPLQLAPDVPMRPNWKGFEKFDPKMGKIVNLHPKVAGSIFWLCDLGKMIKSSGLELMIGDDSYVGPGCPPFQQLAIGLDAGWVEAIEKPQENHVFQDCLLQESPVKYDATRNRFHVPALRPGFGVELDVEKLREKSFEVRTFR